MKKIVITLFIALSLSMGAAFAQTDLQPIAEVKLTGRTPITLGRLKTHVSALEKETGRKMSVEERKKVLDQLIDQHLIVQAAEKDGIKIMDSEVNNYVSLLLSTQEGRPISEADYDKLIKERTNMSLEEYAKAQTGMTFSEYKNAVLRPHLIMQAYVMQKKQNELQSIPAPTDEQIRLFYTMNKQAYVRPDMVKIFIVAAPKGDKASAAEKTIKDIQKKLTANPKATEDILTKSQEKNSGYQAWKAFVAQNPLGAAQLGISIEELRKIFNMKVGEVSPITDTGTHYRCFAVLEKNDAKILDLSDVIEPGGNVSLYEHIKNRIVTQRQNEALNNAAVLIINDLRKPENFIILKTGAELEKALSW